MLRKLLTATLLFFLMLPVAGALAQSGTLTGIVTDSTSGDPLPGVNIRVIGTQLGTSTGPNGEYEIDGVPAGQQVLEVSFVGYRTKEAPVNVQPNATTTRDVRIASAAVQLQDVVVTAMGVERQERSVGYAVGEIEGENLDRTGQANFVDNLAGKIAGANVNTSSGVGGSSRIVLRGNDSITGDNEPLIVIDGVPLDNSNFNSSTQATGRGGYDFGNAASQINPSDVESITVLKGPSAAALYGSRAANGVIEVTTKSGAGQEGVGVTVQSSFTFRELYNFADYQNRYGGGPFAPFAQNADGQLIPYYNTDQSWGPPLDGRLVREWFSYDDVNGMLGETTPWDAHPGNVETFFNSGSTWNTDVSFSQGGENFNYRASLNNVTETGVSEDSQLERKSLSFNGSLDLTDRLTTTLNANYKNMNGEKLPGSGYSGAVSPWQQFNTFGQRQIDLSEGAPMQDLTRPDGTQRSWNWGGNPNGLLASAINGDKIYMNNPYWTVRRNFPTVDMQRVYGKFRVSYDFLENLTLGANVRTDRYTKRQSARVAVGSVGQSSYSEDIYEVSETNAGAELTYDTDLSDDFSLQALAGGNYRYNNLNRNLQSTAGGLSTPGVYTINNSISRPVIDDYFEEEGIFGLYADATVGYRDLVYVGGSVRNDWSSTLPEDNNSYFYPSVRTSFVFSSLPALQDQDVLSYGKLRASWAQVGRDTDPYELAFTFPGSTPFNGRPLQSLPNSLNNAELEPEIKTGWEIGTSLQFFNNRIGLDATYYREVTENQILSVGRTGASGFTGQQLNAGAISNEGVELQLDLTPVLSDDFRWDFSVNWALNENTVEELSSGRTTLPAGNAIGGFGPNLVAQEGEPLGSFYGTGFVTNENGEKVLNDSGSYLTESKILGTYQPDWTGGLRTTLSYKGLSITALANGQKGGEIWSLSNAFGLYSGLLEETVENDIRELGVVPQGVVNTGTAESPSYEPYSEVGSALPPTAFFQGLFSVNEAQLFDASYLKLREVSVSYTLPGNWITNVPSLTGVTVSAIGRNLATLYKESPNFDPSAVTLSNTNIQGVESGQLPPIRSYGLRLRVSF